MDPGGVGGWDAEGGYSCGGEFIDVVCCDECCVAVFEDGGAFSPEFGAHVPFVGGAVGVFVQLRDVDC